MTLKSLQAFFKSDEPLKGCIFYFDTSQKIQKRCFTNDDSTEYEDVDIEVELHHDLNKDLDDINLMLIILKQSSANTTRRVLESNANFYISQYQIDEDFGVFTEISNLEYFLYIGVPVLCLVFVVLAIVLMVYLVKKRRKSKPKSAKKTIAKLQDVNSIQKQPEENTSNAASPNQVFFIPQQAPVFDVSTLGSPGLKLANNQSQ